MQGFDQPKTQFFGFDLALFEAGEAAPRPKASGEKQAPTAGQAVQTTRVKKEVPDLWSAGFDFLHVYDADSTPGTFSFPIGQPAPMLSVFGNRNGMNVYSGYLAGSFFKFDPNIRLHSQFALERNDAVDRRVRAAAWYVEPAYKFSTLPWTPQLNLRYAHFSGDPNPNDRLKQSYDPLFTTGGDRGFGSWFLGEIFGQYISPNSNLDVAMAHLKFAPVDNLDVGIIYYDFHFDQTRSVQQPEHHLKERGAGGRPLFGLVSDRMADRFGGGRLRCDRYRTKAGRAGVCHGQWAAWPLCRPHDDVG